MGNNNSKDGLRRNEKKAPSQSQAQKNIQMKENKNNMSVQSNNKSPKKMRGREKERTWHKEMNTLVNLIGYPLIPKSTTENYNFR